MKSFDAINLLTNAIRHTLHDTKLLHLFSKTVFVFEKKAEQVIRQQLEIRETPDLYCSLGEVTKDIQCFEKAIEISKGRSARAFRMLAKYQFSKEQVRAIFLFLTLPFNY